MFDARTLKTKLRPIGDGLLSAVVLSDFLPITLKIKFVFTTTSGL